MDKPHRNTELLITAVKSYECLWKDRPRDTKGKAWQYAKQSAWEKIGKMFHLHWSDLSESAQDEYITKMKKQWYSLKHFYLDYKKKRDSNEFAKKRKPNHYDALSFLDGDIDQNFNESITSAMQINLDPIPTTSTPVRKKVTKPRVPTVQKKTVENPVINKKNNTKYKLINRKQLNANEHFLFSLLPDMNKMDTRQLMNFKIVIMDAIRHITNENSAAVKVSQYTTKECESTSKDGDLPSKESDSTSVECELTCLRHECSANGNMISNKTSNVTGNKVEHVNIESPNVDNTRNEADYFRKASGITRNEGDSTSKEGNLPVTSTRKPGPKNSKNTSVHCKPAPTMTRESIPSTSIASGGILKATAGKGTTFASRRLSLFLNSPDIWEYEDKPSHANQGHHRDSIQNNHQSIHDLDEETTML